MRELVVFDGTALLFRAYYGAREPMAAPDGTEVAATWGALTTLMRQVRRLRATSVAVVFDAGRATFRNELDPAYKANRGAPPDDLVPQFELVRRGVAALGFPAWEAPGFEADDLMATLAHRARASGAALRLMSVDKDLCQLVCDDAPPVVVEDPHSGRVWDAAGVVERMGVPPDAVVGLLALVGDSSDNVPGVPGVGSKTAAALLQHFGDLDRLFAGLDAVPALPLRGAAAVARKLDAGRDAARRAEALVTLRRDAPLPAADLAAATRWRGPAAGARGFFDALGYGGPLAAAERLADELTPGGQLALL